jgi:hypothetical protein
MYCFLLFYHGPGCRRIQIRIRTVGLILLSELPSALTCPLRWRDLHRGSMVDVAESLCSQDLPPHFSRKMTLPPLSIDSSDSDSSDTDSISTTESTTKQHVPGFCKANWTWKSWVLITRDAHFFHLLELPPWRLLMLNYIELIHMMFMIH